MAKRRAAKQKNPPLRDRLRPGPAQYPVRGARSSMLTPRQKAVVEDTFLAVAPQAEAAAMMFYLRLFKIAPALRPLFRRPLDEQGRKLMQTLTLAVSSLNRLEDLQEPLARLGARHAGYGVRDEHYAVVGEALLWTLREALGTRFDKFAHEAWAALFHAVAGMMREGVEA
jgi:hemoglobin-like flavoprotein